MTQTCTYQSSLSQHFRLLFILGFTLLNMQFVHAKDSPTNHYIDNSVLDFPKIAQGGNNVFQLISHGRSGELFIDGKWLNTEGVVKFLEKRLTKNVRQVNIYGCEFGKGTKGKQSVAELERRLGVSVAASDDITGKDGDWNLEVGRSTNIISFPGYRYNLQYAAGDDLDSDGLINGWDIDDDNDGILDIVETDADTDSDGIINRFDLDSDNDGCSDSVEAGNTLKADNNITAYNSGTDANHNGLLDKFESTTTSGAINYTSTYTQYALIKGLSVCADTDGDGIGDLVDIDDDNDGVLDIVETDADTDGDGIINRLDLDSDNDGCSDGVEASNTLKADNNITAFNTGTDVNRNGLLDKFENATAQGTINYTSTYTLYGNSKSLSVCADTDGDGIGDLIDLDDDNDGVLDTEEVACFPMADLAKTGVVISSSMTWNGALTTLLDGTDNSYQTYPTAAAIANKTVLQFDLPTAQILGRIELSAYSTQTAIVVGAVVRLQGWDGTNWVNIGDNQTVATPTTGISNSNEKSYKFLMANNTTAYTKYRIQGVSGTVQANWLQEAYLTTQARCEDIDTDGDGIFNRLDLDSDNDACSDGVEASNTLKADNNITAFNTGTDANRNGLLDKFENSITQGKINYTSTYALYGNSKSLSVCADTDGDGIGDLIDLDDDNDGVLDTEELYCSPISLDPNTGSTNYVNSGSYDVNHNKPLLNGTVAPSCWAGASETSTAQFVGMKFNSPSTITGVRTQGRGDAAQWVTSYVLEGTKNGTTWVKIATFTGNSDQNTVIYNAVTNTDKDWTGARIRPLTWSAHPSLRFQFELCNSVNTDTDGDGIVNSLDLDSDNDGCSDGVEASNTLKADNNITAFNTGTDANRNGLLDKFENSTTQGKINYTSTYALYGNSKSLSVCADTDGDGIGDLIDLDDDNDGVLDAEEQDNCEYSAQDLTKLTFSGSAVKSTTINTLTTTASGGWKTSYSNQVFKLPIHLEYTLVTQTGYAMVGLLPVNGTQTPNNYNDGAYKFYNASSSGTVYGYFPSEWTFQQAQVESELYEIDINATGYVTVKVSGAVKAQFQGTASDYKLAISAYQEVTFNLLRVSDASKTFACEDLDSDGDGIFNRLDLDSDNDSCGDGVEASNTIKADNNIMTFNTGTDANRNGLLDKFENSITQGKINYISTYKKYAMVKALSVCLDTDNDGIGDLIDIDDDNDGVLDETEQGNCAFTAKDLTKITFNGRAVEAITANTITANNGGWDVHGWSVAYSNEDFKLPIHLEFKLQTTGTSAIGLFPSNSTQATQSYGAYNDGGYKFYNAGNTTNGMFPTAWTFTHTQVAGQIYSIDIDTTGKMVVKIAGVVKQTLQVPKTTYKLVVNGYTTQIYGSVKFSDGSGQYVCENVDTDGDGIPNTLDPDSDNDGCSDAYESGLATTDNATVAGPYGANGFANAIETATESGKYNGTYTYNNALSTTIRTCPTCPTITNTAANNTVPTTCTATDGTIRICGLPVNTTNITIAYDKNGIPETEITNLTVNANGCVTISNLDMGTYSNIKVKTPFCKAGSNSVGPIILAIPDNIKPVITNCPTNINLTTTDTAAVATYTEPTATDNCSEPTVTRTAGLESGANFPVGATIVTYAAIDARGNTATCSFIVNVSVSAQTGAITGVMYNDDNNNGSKDGAEAPIANATVTLCNSNGTVVATTTTNANGAYTFSNLAPNSYIVKFPTTANGKPLSTSNNLIVPVTAGQTVPNKNAGYYQPTTPSNGSIGDLTFNDNNGNGIFDTGDTPKSNIPVTLCNSAGETIGTKLTVSGNYSFTNLAAGTYIVKFTPVHTDGKSLTTPQQITVNLAAGQNYTSADAGYKTQSTTPINGSIGDLAFNDNNNNGIYDSGETPIAGVAVSLCNTSNVVLGSTTTNAAGNYSFGSLVAGTYIVKFPQTLADGKTITTQQQITVNLVAGQNYTSADAGYKTSGTTPSNGSIGDLTFNDNNGNGVFDTGDTPKSNILVTLCNSAGETIATKLSVSGNYSFGNLAAGTYIVKFAPVHTDGKALTTPQQITVNLAAGQNYTSADAGYKTPSTTPTNGSIGDLAFNDNNNNGIFDNGESPIAGVAVSLCNTSNVVLGSTTTNAAGNYSFGSLVAGTYIVKFPQTLADGKTITTQQQITVNLVAGQNYTSADAGYKTSGTTPSNGSIGDLTFNDNNGNGVFDTGDTPKSNILVTLCNSAGETIATKLSVSGNYSFGNLAAGTYIVKFAPVHTDGKALTTPQQITVNLAAGQNYTSADAGYKTPSTTPTNGSIGDLTFNDNNGNGIFDTGDTPKSNILVTLCNSAGQTIATKLTVSGNYSFTNLTAGTYIVKFTPVHTDGKALTTPQQITVNLAAGQNYTSADAGYKTPSTTPANGSIGDLVFADNNNNGVYDNGDTPIADVMVTLCNTSNVVISSTTTNTAGNYSFGNLAAGTYIVKFLETLADGKSITTEQQITVNLTAGQNYTSADAGYFKPTSNGTSSIKDVFVYCDNNNNQVYDGGDNPIEGVTVTLCNTDNQVITTSITDASGTYSFLNLAAGTYIVKFPATLTDGKKVTTSNPITITLGDGETSSAADAAYAKPATVDCNETRTNTITKACTNNIPVLIGTALPGYEYMWLSSTSACPSTSAQAIPDATQQNYSLPSSVNQTTYFMRCARPIGCTVWGAITESNCLTINSSDCTVDGLKCDDVIVKGNSDGTISVTGIGAYTSYVQVINNQLQTISNSEYNQPDVSIPVKNGTYSVNVLLYDASDGGWLFLCEKTVAVTVSGGLNALSKNILLDINAFAEAQRAQIQWINNTGSFNDFFTVEKRNNVSGNFEKIETVNSKPTEENEVYSIYDNAITEGDNTYRVQLTMFDGQVKTSAVKTLTYQNLNDVRIFPNPASDFIDVDLKSYEGKKVTLYIYNQVGKLIQTQQIERASATPIHLDMDKQSSGQMLLRVTAEGRKEVTKKFVIQN